MGVLNVDKPSGWTSHDVVAKIRRIIGQRRVGHAGTLDPMATGVLVVCLGKATRLVEYLADLRKAYRATVHLGVETDTWDAEGSVVAREDASYVTLEQIESVLGRFRGEIQQIPPMYSALKQEGRPLYRLARQGITVEREPRPVHVYRLDVVEWDPPRLSLDLVCSKGTYVRSLAHDLGQALESGAHLAELSRRAVGHFTLENAVPLDALIHASSVQPYLLSARAALKHLPGVQVDAEQANRLAHGQDIALSAAPQAWDICCAYDADQELVAILRPDASGQRWRPAKVFVDPSQK